jgi:methylisocitrate lyase
MTDLPVLVDADTGFGEPMNVARSVQIFEDAGVAGIHLEDQVNPKRCGHLDGKTVVDEITAVQRIRAAVAARRDPTCLIMARTDIRAIAGLESATLRAKKLVDAGADAIFPEAMRSLKEFAAMRAAVDVPILANMTEFGKSELFTVDQLAGVGIDLVIFPVSLFRLALGAAERGLDALATEGSLLSQVPFMQTRARLYELLDYQSYSAFDSGVCTFDLKNNHS